MNNHLREMLEGSKWRILPLDALPSDKFVAEMVFKRLDDEMFPGHTVAHGNIYNDSRGLFRDGEPVRTSSIKDIHNVNGVTYIETRNTMYKLIEQPVHKPSVHMRDHDDSGWQPK